MTSIVSDHDFVQAHAFSRAAQLCGDIGLRLAGLCLALLGGAGLLTQMLATEPAREAEPVATARPVWIDLAKPVPLFALAAPRLAQEKSHREARRHASGGGREDVLTFGEFAAQRNFLRLAVYRRGAETAVEAAFFVEMARRAAPLGLAVVHADVERDQPTRFGPLATAALTLSEGGVARENCRGFLLRAESPAVTMAGLACAPAGETMAPAELACLVERIEFVGGTAERPLADFFAAAKARPIAENCAPRPAAPTRAAAKKLSRGGSKR